MQNNQQLQDDKQNNLQVYLRIRPSIHEPQFMIPNKIFQLPQNNVDLFYFLSKNLNQCLNGFNLTILAYGQTSSGKTYTMLGPDGKLSVNEETMGLIPRTCQYLFSQICKQNDFIEVSVGYYEIYQGRVKDLLTGLDLNGNLQDLTHSSVTSTKDILEILMKGSEKRFTAKTNMNEHSSRSHAIFEINIEKKIKTEKATKFQNLKGVINLVDLAGSEDISRSGVQGDRLKEATRINTDLFHLHRVFDAIVSKSKHVPFRDSILTKLLQTSLKGSSQTIFIAHVSPDPQNTFESQSTISQALIAQQVITSPSQNIQIITTFDPLENDYIDHIHNKQTIFINTDYGKIFCRISGTNNQDSQLILLIHGSGPENSSLWWNLYVNQLLNHKLNFFFIQIDCPGYGRSTGDKQTIRSYPAEFIKNLINQLGYQKTYCLIGSSQGAASIFNAVVQDPQITEFFAVMDPVSHDPTRFIQIKQFALLVYDVEDDGHPVKVGRLVKNYMKNNYYYEFANSKQPNYLRDNFVKYLVTMLNQNDNSFKLQTIQQENYIITLNFNMMLQGGVLSWSKPYGREINHYFSDDDYLQIQTDFEEKEMKKFEKFRNNQEEQKEENKIIALQCSICNIDPDINNQYIDIPKCGHKICEQCIQFTLSINPGWCPIQKCQQQIVPSAKSIKYKLQKEENFIIFGNYAQEQKDSYFKIKPFIIDNQKIIKEVFFDINPQYPKSAIRVSNTPFEIERTMQSKFPSNFVIKWKDNSYNDLFISYLVEQKYSVYQRVLLVRFISKKSKNSKQQVIYKWYDQDENIFTFSTVDIL